MIAFFSIFCILVDEIIGNGGLFSNDVECDNWNKNEFNESPILNVNINNTQKSCSNVSISSGTNISATVFYVNNGTFTLSGSKFNDLAFNRIDTGGGLLYGTNAAGVTITDCSFTNVSISGDGGVVYVTFNTSLTGVAFSVTNSYFTSCRASSIGGAIYVSVGSSVSTQIQIVSIVSSNFTDCIAGGGFGDAAGGAVYLKTDGTTAFNPNTPTFAVVSCQFDSNHVRNSTGNNAEANGTALSVSGGVLNINTSQLLDWTGIAVLLQALNCTQVVISNSTIRGRHLSYNDSDNDTSIFSSYDSKIIGNKHLLGAEIGSTDGLLNFINCQTVSITNSSVVESRHGGIYATATTTSRITITSTNFQNNLAGNTERFPSLRLNFICGTPTVSFTANSSSNTFADVVHYVEKYKWYDFSVCTPGSETEPNITIPAPLIQRVEVINRELDDDWRNRTSSFSLRGSSSSHFHTSSSRPHPSRHTHGLLQEAVFDKQSSLPPSLAHPHSPPHRHAHSHSRQGTLIRTHTDAHMHTPRHAPPQMRGRMANEGYDSLKINGFFLFPLAGTKAIVSDAADSTSTVTVDSSDSSRFAYADQHTLIFELPEAFKRATHPSGINISILSSDVVQRTVANVPFVSDSVGTIWGEWSPDWKQMDFDDAYGIDSAHPDASGSVRKALYRGLIGGIVLIVILIVIVVLFTVFLWFLRKRSIAEYLRLHGNSTEGYAGGLGQN